MGPQAPILISCVVGTVGLLGIVAGILALVGISREKKFLEQGTAQFIEMAQAGGIDNHSPDAWLASHGLPSDSHFGDRLFSVWGGWMSGRVPTLMELHSLSIGRERRRLWARLAGGITGLLVVSGIAGTLFCIHPILLAFDITPNAAGVADTGVRAKSAMDMIQNLSRAFWPSLTALVFTLFVASARGIYLHDASKLARDLDRLSVDTLFPNFRARSFGEELTELRRELSELADRMDTRDKSVGELVDKLKTNIKGLQSSEASLKSAAEDIAEAATNMATEAGHVRSGFEIHLGETSPVVKGLAAIASAAITNETTAEKLREAGFALGAAAEAAKRQVEQAGAKFDQAIITIPDRIAQGCAAGTEELVAASQAAATAAAAVTAAGSVAAGKLHEAGLAVGAAAEAATRQVAQAGDKFDQVIINIPARIAQGCAAGVEELVATSQTAAAAVSASGVATAEILRQAVASVPAIINEGSARASQEMAEACRGATDVAAATIADAGAAVSASLQAQVEPIRTAAAEINDANATLQTEVRQTLTGTLNGIQESIASTSKQLDHTQRAANRAVETADRLLQHVADFESIPSWPKRFWRRVTGPFRNGR